MGNKIKQKMRILQMAENCTGTAQSVPVVTLSPANLQKMKSD